MVKKTTDKLLDLFGGVMLVIVVASVVVTAWFSIQVHTLVVQNTQMQQLRAQEAKPTTEYIKWLTRSLESVCKSDHAHCPHLPKIKGLNK